MAKYTSVRPITDEGEQKNSHVNSSVRTQRALPAPDEQGGHGHGPANGSHHRASSP
jgi:hypothetical protein